MKKIELASYPFLSINGECCNSGQGSWAVFVRVQGCSLHCSYCDSKYTWCPRPLNKFQTKLMYYTPHQIFKQVVQRGQGVKRIVLTGGEPLEQDMDSIISFLKKADKYAYEVSIETNGMHSIRPISALGYRFVFFVIDAKLGEDLSIFMNNIQYLTDKDIIKIMLTSEEQFDEALRLTDKLLGGEYPGAGKGRDFYFEPKIYFSSTFPTSTLFKMVKSSHLASYININVQLHKFIFSENFREEEEN